MRTIVFIVSVLLFFSCAHEQKNPRTPSILTKIDSLQDVHEVREFVKTVNPSMKDFLCIAPHDYNLEHYGTNEIKLRLDVMVPKVYYIKEDFDNNGYTDLIVTGEKYQNAYEVLAIMNFGTDTYAVESLSLERTRDFQTYPKLVYINHIPMIELYTSGAFLDNMVDGISTKTLVYAFGTFIEYNTSFADYKITKINFSKDGCHGSCPVFDLILHKDSISTFKAMGYNFSRKQESYIHGEGTFETIIDTEKFEEIESIIKYININKLNDKYILLGMHQETATLTVTFTDGSSKTIEDTGLVGTNGLHLLYKKLSALRFHQDWRRIP